MNTITSFRDKLFMPVSSASLGLFRILVGFILFFQTSSLISSNFVQEHIFESKIRFPFEYFEFLEPLPKDGMRWLLLLMLGATVFMILGRFFKIATFLYTVSFTYLWLLDKSYFNNHYYFITLLGFLLIFTQADSWGALKGKNRRETIPYWHVYILKLQLLLVLFISGINKINYHWLIDFQPMKHILETKAAVDGYDWLLNDFFYIFFTWGGMLLDLLIGFLLWNKRTRKFAITAFILFNLINYWLFHDIGEIGFFPFLLLACVSVFLDPLQVKAKLNWIVPQKVKPITKISETRVVEKIKKSNIVFGLIVVYFSIQILVPFRHLLYDDHVDWTGEGQRFSWRMKIMYKEVDMHFYLIEEGKSEKLEVNVGHFLNDKQYTNLMYYPDLVPLVGAYISDEGRRRKLSNPDVVSTFYVGFNGRPSQLLFDSTLRINRLSPEKSNWIFSLQ